MNLTTTEIAHVQSSFDLVAPKADSFVTGFYNELFSMAPELRSMFPSDLTAQRQKLTAVLATAIGALTRLETLVPVLQDLGKRHVGYGVETAHYDVVGQALLTALETDLGKDWTDDVAQAWTKLFTIIRATMLAGAQSHKEDQAA